MMTEVMDDVELPVLDDDEEELEELAEEIVEPIFDPDSSYTVTELEAFADDLLKKDSNRELCRTCRIENPNSLPYGEETGEIESKAQYENGKPLLDENDEQLYIDFPILRCERGHCWPLGEGQRRDIRGPNPILFESHLYNRKRREIYVEAGTPDPAFTLDRFGRPTTGIYNRSHPAGRKINSKAQRAKSGASYYR